MKKTILLSGAAAILLFAAGMGSGWLLFHQDQETAPEREIRVRVADGNVEWSAGGEWNQAGTVAQLQEGQPFCSIVVACYGKHFDPLLNAQLCGKLVIQLDHFRRHHRAIEQIAADKHSINPFLPHSFCQLLYQIALMLQ